SARGGGMGSEIHIAKPAQPGVYGPDLIDRWKGRAFQQSPDSTISLVCFEGEQGKWEGDRALPCARAGPVRAHRDCDPIPPDGLYPAWNNNQAVPARYYNTIKPAGVPIDGQNDDVGNVD